MIESDFSPDTETVREYAEELGLKMRTIKTEFIGQDKDKKFFVYFTANKRVDFRELVRKLAKKYRCRIEMRQITPREHAAILGGINVCGKVPCFRPFCHKKKWGGCYYDKEGLPAGFEHKEHYDEEGHCHDHEDCHDCPDHDTCPEHKEQREQCEWWLKHDKGE
jgi:hypothetical protein